MRNAVIERDVVIIGAGAAGLMCAIEAGKRGRSVSVLDHSDKIGKKIRVSGGGRCNFTNTNAGPDNYISNNPHFCKSALSRFRPGDFIAMLGRHGIKHHEKEEGQLFCDETSGKIINMLKRECDSTGVEIRLNCNISGVRKNNSFSVMTNLGTFESESLIIAAGGLSYRALGASGFGHRIARQFGLGMISLKPALVPMIFNSKDMNTFGELSGISVNAIVSCGKKSFHGDILFTHNGLSGPAILQISSYWNQGDNIALDLLPGISSYELLKAGRQSKAEIQNFLSEYLPKRFIQKWCSLYAGSKPLRQYTEKELKDIASKLQRWEITPKGTEGYDIAEVTLGGVDTDELSSKTMESKKVQGLYFIGEVVDVTGHLGGYNLQWAWSSGYAAGQYA